MRPDTKSIVLGGIIGLPICGIIFSLMTSSLKKGFIFAVVGVTVATLIQFIRQKEL